MLISEAMLFALHRSLPDSMGIQEKNRICEVARIALIISHFEEVTIKEDHLLESVNFRDKIFSELKPYQCTQNYINCNMNVQCYAHQNWGVTNTSTKETK